MIVFDLLCDRVGHVFEAWFANSAAYDDQRKRGLLACPMCGDANVGKALMAPYVGAKGNQIVTTTPAQMVAALPDEIKATLATIAKAQTEALKDSKWVGSNFDREARAMDAGDIPTATIHGQATLAQAKALVEDGIGVLPLPMPVIPPEQCN